MFSLDVRAGVKLVLAEPGHAEAVADLIARNFNRLAAYEPWGDVAPDAATMRARIQERGEAFAQGRGVRTYIRVGNRFVGACGLRLDPPAGSAEVGFWLDLDFEGQGLASDCVRALVGLAFTEYDLRRVTLKTHTENVRARKLAERLGFVYEGQARSAISFGADRYGDEVTYAVLVDEWVPAS